MTHQCLYLITFFSNFVLQTNDKWKINIFTKRVYIMKKLKIKIFMNYNILNFEKMMINIEKTNLIINSCKNLKIQFNVTNTNSSIKTMTKINECIKISIKFLIIISFKFRNKDDLSTKRNFMFYFSRIPKLKNKKNVFSHIIDVFIKMIQI